MASKTSKKANAAVKKQGNAPVPKDNGDRWVVMHKFEGTERQLYPGSGLKTADAEQLARGVLGHCWLKQVGWGDGKGGTLPSDPNAVVEDVPSS